MRAELGGCVLFEVRLKVVVAGVFVEHVVLVTSQLNDTLACQHLLVAEAALALVRANLRVNSATDPATRPLNVRFAGLCGRGRPLTD